MLNRYKDYNDTLDYIEQLEHDGLALVIRPTKELEVGRLEKDPQKLYGLLQNGYYDAKDISDKIIKFISNSS